MDPTNPPDDSDRPNPGCSLCHGTGSICTGTSGTDEDGNAPIIEPCYICFDL